MNAEVLDLMWRNHHSHCYKQFVQRSGLVLRVPVNLRLAQSQNIMIVGCIKPYMASFAERQQPILIISGNGCG